MGISMQSMQYAQAVESGFYGCFDPIINVLLALSSGAYLADTGFIVTDLTVGLNGTQNDAMKTLPAAGLSVQSSVSYVLSVFGFSRWWYGEVLPPGARKYHFITTAGGATGLLLICEGILSENTWVVRAGNLVASVFFTTQSITTKWRAPGLHPVAKWQAIGANIGGLLFTASSFVPEGYYTLAQSLLASGLTTMSFAILPAVFKYFIDAIIARHRLRVSIPG